MAYGARAVLVGRPILWGLAIGGEAGVKSVLEMLRQEFDLAMALSGCPTLAAITRDLVRPFRIGDSKASANQVHLRFRPTTFSGCFPQFSLRSAEVSHKHPRSYPKFSPSIVTAA